MSNENSYFSQNSASSEQMNSVTVNIVFPSLKKTADWQ
jgi:hypothetical protein